MDNESFSIEVLDRATKTLNKIARSLEELNTVFATIQKDSNTLNASLDKTSTTMSKVGTTTDTTLKHVRTFSAQLGKSVSTMNTIANAMNQMSQNMARLASASSTSSAGLQRLSTVSSSTAKSTDKTHKAMSHVISTLKKMETSLKKIAQVFDKFGNSMQVAAEQGTPLVNVMRNTAHNMQVVTDRGGKMNFTIKQTGDNAANAQKKVGGYNSLLGSLYFSFIKVSTAAYGFVSAIRGISNQLQPAMEFQFAIAQAGVVADASAMELNRLRDSALELGRVSMKTITDVANAEYQLASLGLTADEVVVSLKGIVLFSEAAAIEVEESARAIGSAVRSFQLDFSEAAHVADVFEQAIRRSALQGQDFTRLMAGVGPVANLANQGIEETVASLGLLKSSGLTARFAAAQLRQALFRLISPSDKARKAMSELGINIRDELGQLKDLPSIIKEFEQGLSKLDQAARDKALVDIFGRGGFRAIAVLLQEGSQGLRVFSEDLRSADGVVDKVAGTMREQLVGQLKQVQSEFDSMKVSILETNFGIFLKDILQTTKAFARFVSGSKSAQKALITITKIIAIIPLGLMIISLIKLAQIFKTWTVEIIKSTVALFTHKAAEDAAAASAKKLAVATGTAATAMRILKIALPIGGILLLVEGISYLMGRVKDTRLEMEYLTEAVNKSGAEYLQEFRGIEKNIQGREDLVRVLEDLRDERDRLLAIEKKTKDEEDRLVAVQNRLETVTIRLSEAYDGLDDQFKELAVSGTNFVRVMEQMLQAESANYFIRLKDTIEKYREEQRKAKADLKEFENIKQPWDLTKTAEQYIDKLLKVYTSKAGGVNLKFETKTERDKKLAEFLIAKQKFQIPGIAKTVLDELRIKGLNKQEEYELVKTIKNAGEQSTKSVAKELQDLIADTTQQGIEDGLNLADYGKFTKLFIIKAAKFAGIEFDKVGKDFKLIDENVTSKQISRFKLELDTMFKKTGLDITAEKSVKDIDKLNRTVEETQEIIDALTLNISEGIFDPLMRDVPALDAYIEEFKTLRFVIKKSIVPAFESFSETQNDRLEGMKLGLTALRRQFDLTFDMDNYPYKSIDALTEYFENSFDALYGTLERVRGDWAGAFSLDRSAYEKQIRDAEKMFEDAKKRFFEKLNIDSADVNVFADSLEVVLTTLASFEKKFDEGVDISTEEAENALEGLNLALEGMVDPETKAKIVLEMMKRLEKYSGVGIFVPGDVGISKEGYETAKKLIPVLEENEDKIEDVTQRNFALADSYEENVKASKALVDALNEEIRIMDFSEKMRSEAANELSKIDDVMKKITDTITDDMVKAYDLWMKVFMSFFGSIRDSRSETLKFKLEIDKLTESFRTLKPKELKEKFDFVSKTPLERLEDTTDRIFDLNSETQKLIDQLGRMEIDWKNTSEQAEYFAEKSEEIIPIIKAISQEYGVELPANLGLLRDGIDLTEKDIKDFKEVLIGFLKTSKEQAFAAFFIQEFVKVQDAVKDFRKDNEKNWSEYFSELYQTGAKWAEALSTGLSDNLVKYLKGEIPSIKEAITQFGEEIIGDIFAQRLRNLMEQNIRALFAAFGDTPENVGVELAIASEGEAERVENALTQFKATFKDSYNEVQKNLLTGIDAVYANQSELQTKIDQTETKWYNQMKELYLSLDFAADKFDAIFTKLLAISQGVNQELKLRSELTGGEYIPNFRPGMFFEKGGTEELFAPGTFEPVVDQLRDSERQQSVDNKIQFKLLDQQTNYLGLYAAQFPSYMNSSAASLNAIANNTHLQLRTLQNVDTGVGGIKDINLDAANEASGAPPAWAANFINLLASMAGAKFGRGGRYSGIGSQLGGMLGGAAGQAGKLGLSALGWSGGPVGTIIGSFAGAAIGKALDKAGDSWWAPAEDLKNYFGNIVIPAMKDWFPLPSSSYFSSARYGKSPVDVSPISVEKIEVIGTADPEATARSVVDQLTSLQSRQYERVMARGMRFNEVTMR